MGIEFFMPMKTPTVTHQEKKWRVVKGKPVPYEPPEVRAARSKLTAHLAGHRPVEPLAGAVRLLVKWCFPRGQHEDGEYRTTRPDTDNLQKLLKDCMTAVGFWRDDAQVSSEIVEKFWAEVPGIYVCMEQINARENCQAIANLEVLTCAGCAEDGKWEWEYQNGAECPCTYCKRRAADCYHRPPEGEA